MLILFVAPVEPADQALCVLPEVVVGVEALKTKAGQLAQPLVEFGG